MSNKSQDSMPDSEKKRTVFMNHLQRGLPLLFPRITPNGFNLKIR